jgi:hypothetical protein
MDEAGDTHEASGYRATIRRSDALAGTASAIIERVTSPLSAIAVEKRRQLAATLGLFAMLFIAVGAVAATGATTPTVKAFVLIALLVAVLLGLTAWGVAHSVRLDLADRKLDATIEAAVKASGRSMCDCGVEHDPNEMHIVDACEHDGSGVECEHSCDTCVLTAMRPSPNRTRAERLGTAQPG